MSLKKILPLLSLLLLGCNDKKPSFEERLSQLNEAERDSLTDMYHEYSMQFYQTSELHRRLKDTALLVSPDHVEYRQRLSYSYKKAGEHIKAMEILNQAVTLDVEDGKTSALQYRAWSLLYFYRDYEGTIEDVDLINKMEPQNNYTSCHGEPCNVLKGQALYKLGRFQEAIAVFEALLEVEKEKGWEPAENFPANFYMARCYSELEEYERALEIYKGQLEQDDRFTEVYYQMGRISNQLGQKEQARQYLEKAKDLLAEGYKMGEPYYEAFDEVFLYQIEEELAKSS